MPRDVCATHPSVINDTLFQAMPDLRQTLLQFIDVINLMGIANVSVHASMPKEDILALNVAQEYTIKFIWLIVSTIRQNGDTVLETLDLCYIVFLICFFTRWCSDALWVCGKKRHEHRGKFNADSNSEKKFENRSTINIYHRSYERISSDTFLMAHGVDHVWQVSWESEKRCRSSDLKISLTTHIQRDRQTNISVTHIISSIRCKQQLSLMAPTYKNCRSNAWARYTYDEASCGFPMTTKLMFSAARCNRIYASDANRSARHCTLYTALSILYTVSGKRKESQLFSL